MTYVYFLSRNEECSYAKRVIVTGVCIFICLEVLIWIGAICLGETVHSGSVSETPQKKGSGGKEQR